MMLRIGDLARESGVTVEAVRYYEREALLGAPCRDANGYRQFDRNAVKRIRFIKRAQQVGFKLKDIKDLLSLQADPDASCRDVRERAERKVGEIEDRIGTLFQMKAVLSGWIEECEGAGPVGECPILDALEADDEV